MNKRKKKKATKLRDKESYTRMEGIRQSNASGINDKAQKGYSKRDRANNRQEERGLNND